MYAGSAVLKDTGALFQFPENLRAFTKSGKYMGKNSLNRLVTRAAQIAQNGFKISPYLYMQMTKTESNHGR